MNWSDEHYVKLYTRDSLTWRSWHWEARTVFLHLVRKVDNSGFIETGRMSIVDALVLQLELPKHVVEPGMAALIGCGTCEAVDGAVLLVKFNEAQEARKTDAQKKRDERSRNIAKRRGRMSPAVTGSHPVSPAVTQTDPPSPAQPVPSPAQPEKTAGKKPPAASVELPDPRHAPLRKALCEATPEYTFDGGRDAKQVTLLLAKGPPDEVVKRWRRAWTWPLAFPRVRTLTELVAMWPHFATDAPTAALKNAPTNPDQDFPRGILNANPV